MDKGINIMREEKINLSIIIRIAVSLIPIFLGMPTIAMIICAYNIAMSLILIGPMTCLISSLSAVLLSMLFCGFIAVGGELQGLFLSLEAVLAGVVCAVVTIRRESFYKGIWLTAAAYLIPSYINVMQSAHKAGQSVSDYLTLASFDQIKLSLAQTLSQLQLSEETLFEILDTIRETTIMIIPSVLVIVSIVIGYAIMWYVNYTLRKLPVKNREDHSFSRLRMPRLSIIVFVLVVIAFFVSKSQKFDYVLVNMLVVLGTLCFFSGMSVVDFYLRKKIKNIFPRLLIHFAIYMISGVFTGIIPFANIFLIYILLSVVDSFVNIRRIKTNDKEGEINEEE